MPTTTPHQLTNPKPPVGTTLWCHLRLPADAHEAWQTTVVRHQGLYVTLGSGERFHTIDDRIAHERGWRCGNTLITFTPEPPSSYILLPVAAAPRPVTAPPEPPHGLDFEDWLHLSRCALARAKLCPDGSGRRRRELDTATTAHNRAVALLLP